MLNLSASQTRWVEHRLFIDKADRALVVRVPEWAASPVDERRDFISMCLERSARHGLRSEQSVMAYALGALWLGLAFEEESPLLLQLLAAPVPELRKSHGLSEWVSDQLGAAASPASGDAAIRTSFALTMPWGRT